MMKRTCSALRFLFPVILIILLPALVSCGRGGSSSLKKESLFSMEFGKMEDQLNVFHRPDNNSLYKDRIFMQNGIFYISNGPSSKIMEFNSYGDIINLFYNQDQNPEPVMLRKKPEENVAATRNVYAYPFQDVGEMAVNSQKTLFVDDRIDRNRIEYDSALEVSLDRIILQFDKAGNFLDYLGQEGSGGTPFSAIDKIRINQRDELAVFTRNKTGWKIFWFSSAGTPLYTVDIGNDSLPFPGTDEEQYGFSALETIDCDTVERTLYLKGDYYIDYSQVLNTERTGIEFSRSVIWFMDMATGRYTGSVEIPAYTRQENGGGNGKEESPLIYELLGVQGRGNFFLISLNGRNDYNLMIMDRDGKVNLRRQISLGEDRLIFHSFSVDAQGILTGLLGWENRAEVAWWRTDEFIQPEEP